MSLKLIIAEKPSVAQSIAHVLGATTRKDGYTEGGGFLVSWCVGHLIGLASADAYDAKYSKWAYEDLPILPERWQYAADRDKEKQLAVLRALMGRADVDAVFAHGIDAVSSVLYRPCTIDEALTEGNENLRRTARNIAAILAMGLNLGACRTSR